MFHQKQKCIAHDMTMQFKRDVRYKLSNTISGQTIKNQIAFFWLNLSLKKKNKHFLMATSINTVFSAENRLKCIW